MNDPHTTAPFGKSSSWSLTGALIAALAGVYLGSSYQQTFRSIDEQIVLHLAAWNGPVVHQGQWWRILTAGLLHADPMHLLVNAIALKALGDRVERGAGAPRLAVVFLATSAAGSITPLLTSAAPAVGASAGISGLLGLSLWWTFARGLDEPLAGFVKGWRLSLVVWAALTIGSGVFMERVSQGAHAGGFVMGLLCGVILQAWGALPDLARAFGPVDLPPPPREDPHHREPPPFHLPRYDTPTSGAPPGE